MSSLSVTTDHRNTKLQDGVILLHGIGRTHRNMDFIEKNLAAGGYNTCNLSYPSTQNNIAENADFVHEKCKEFISRTPGKLHIVGFSMGGLVARALISRHRPENLGRVVMIGTPNHGSEIADLLNRNKVFRLIYGPAGQQLITENEGYKSQLGTVDFELGIIAGKSTFHPLASIVFKRESDGIVSVESTKIEGMKDHIVIPLSHTLLPVAKQASVLTLRFLETGSFH